MIVDKNKITFEPIEHKYTDETGRELISVSQLVHKFAPEFDADGSILKRCAAKKGITEEELQAEWTKTNKDSCDYGHTVHAEVEHYIKYKKYKKGGLYKDVVKEFKKIPFKGPLQSEIRLSHLGYRIAGTTDLVEFIGENIVNLYDLKTNKKINTYCPFGNRMLPPFNYYYSTNFFHYTLQLNVYAFMLEEMGYWVNSMTLLHVSPKTYAIKTYDIPFKRPDTIKLVKMAKQFLK